MQELLTGKRRLKNFSGEWEEILLSDVAYILNGDRGINYPSVNDFVDFGIPFVNAGHLKNHKIDFSHMDYISKEHYEKLSGAKLQIGDIVFCLRGSLGKFALVSFDEGAPASSLCVIRCKDKRQVNYVFHLLGTESTRCQIENANTGSSQPNLSAADVSHFTYKMPTDVKEQQAIAEVLTDMDNEISALQKKLDKIRRIKQGMMAELLTGRIRLI